MVFIFHSGLCRYSHLSCREPSPCPRSLRPPPLSVRSQPNRFGRLAGMISDFTAVIFHFSARQERRAGWQFGCERQRDNQEETTNGGASHIFKLSPLPHTHTHVRKIKRKRTCPSWSTCYLWRQSWMFQYSYLSTIMSHSFPGCGECTANILSWHLFAVPSYSCVWFQDLQSITQSPPVTSKQAQIRPTIRSLS